MRAKKYLWSILCVYFCYLTHGIQAIILSQNNVNFAKQWGFNMTDPQSAAYAAGLAAVSTAVAWTGFGKFVSVWIGGEISDHVGRKKLMIGGAALYILCFLGFLFTKSALVASVCGFVSGKTAKSILISCGARLAPFDIAELRELMSYDEMELDMIGDQRTALFIVISDTDDTFNFVVAMMYSQLFNLLCDRADDVHHGRLPYHVRILCDEFANIGQIPKFDKLIATIRSREISASIILQSQSQLKTIYKDAAETITGNCDTMLFLGGKESTTLKEISETLGKETIDLYNTSDTRGQSRSYGLNYQKTGKELMSRDELAVMDGNKCILQLRGVRPFYSDKFDITKHKRYKQLSDYDKKNEFHVEEYMKHQMEVRLSPEEAFDLYVYEGSELEKQSNNENEGTGHVT